MVAIRHNMSDRMDNGHKLSAAETLRLLEQGGSRTAGRKKSARRGAKSSVVFRVGKKERIDG